MTDVPSVYPLKVHFVEGVGWRGIYLIDGLRCTVFAEKEEELQAKAEALIPAVGPLKEKFSSIEYKWKLRQHLVWLYGEDSEEVKYFCKKHNLSVEIVKDLEDAEGEKP